VMRRTGDRVELGRLNVTGLGASSHGSAKNHSDLRWLARRETSTGLAHEGFLTRFYVAMPTASGWSSSDDRPRRVTGCWRSAWLALCWCHGIAATQQCEGVARPTRV